MALAATVAIACLSSACVSEEREQELGDMMADEINAQLPMVEDPILNAWVSSLGRALTEVSERPALHYRFYVINTPAVNAFALPGGHIYLTRGLIEQTRTGPELAAALAHEIGHVAERHGVDKMERRLRTGSLVGVLYTLILGGEPDLLRREALELGGALWSARHSREAEQEADARAVEYLQRAGLDPVAMVTLLQRLLVVEAQDSSRVAGWFSSHPLTRDRIVAAEREIADTHGQIGVQRGGSVEFVPGFLEGYPLFLERLATVPGPSLLR